MRRSLNLLLGRQHRPSFVCYRYIWNAANKRYEGIREKFDEYQARFYFDEWLKSLWFAPGGWTRLAKGNTITVTKSYVPFWNFSLCGSIDTSLTLEERSRALRGGIIWDSVSTTANNFSLDNINIYAAQTLDRYHLNNLNISLDNRQILNLDNQQKYIEQWTVDKDTAFQIGWDLNIIHRIKQLCIQQAKQTYPQFIHYQVDSFHFNINLKQERLLYYPIYLVNYQYGSKLNFTCLVDGVTGQVTGDRQYSMKKVTLATLIGGYPMALIALITLGSLIDPYIGIALTSPDSFKISVPIGFIVAPLVGLYAREYPTIYRQKINQQQWQNYRSNASQFTYDFTTPFQQQYQSYRQQQQQSYRQEQQQSYRQQQQQQQQQSYRQQQQQQQQQSYRQQQQQQQSYRQQQQQRTKEPPPRQEETTMDLYNLLSVSRTANEKEIKRAYLLKAKQLHPDLNPGDKNAEELFKKVNQAYAILSDKNKREQYDKYGYESVKYN